MKIKQVTRCPGWSLDCAETRIVGTHEQGKKRTKKCSECGNCWFTADVTAAMLTHENSIFLLPNMAALSRGCKPRIRTPLPSGFMMGNTFSLLIHCRTRGAPYCAPRQEEREEMYNPNKNRTPTKETLDAIM